MKTSLFCCKLVAAAAFSAVFAGCSLTPEQEQAMHEAAMRSLQSNSDFLRDRQQQIHEQQRQTQQQMRQQSQRNVHCTSRRVGDTTYTDCY